MGLPLSELIRLIGDEHCEIHPIVECVTGAKALKQGGHSISMTIVNRRLTVNDVFAMSEGHEPQFTGMVITFPQSRYNDAFKTYRANEVSRLNRTSAPSGQDDLPPAKEQP